MATATKPMMLDETGKQIVDELKKIADIKGSAIGTTFDDTNAHLGTNNVQGAIDKLKSNADTLAGKVATAEQNISTNTQNIATNAEAISQQSSQIADISSEIKVEKSVVVDDYALVESGSGVFNDLMVYGRSKQDKTSGKNLLDCSGLTSQTVNGVTYTPVYNSDGLLEYINVNGNASESSSYRVYRGYMPIGNFVLNGTVNGSSNSYYIYLSGKGGDFGNGYAFADDGSTLRSITINIEKGITVNNVRFYPMIRLASITDPTYEPYTMVHHLTHHILRQFEQITE